MSKDTNTRSSRPWLFLGAAALTVPVIYLVWQYWPILRLLLAGLALIGPYRGDLDG